MFFFKFRNLCFTSMMKTTQKTELLRRNGHAAHAVLMRSAISIPQATMSKQRRLCRKNRSTCSIRQFCFDVVAGVEGA